MIKNTKQEGFTREKVIELQNLRNKVSEDDTLTALEKQFNLNSLDGMIATLEEELVEYRNLKSGNIQILEAKSLEEFPKILIKARIVRQMSQTSLGKLLGMQPQQIQRYEANEYQNVSFDRLLEIAKTIGVCINIEKTLIVGSGPLFTIPSNVDELTIKKAEERIKSKCLIIS